MTNSEAIQILKQYLDMDSEVKSEYLEAQRVAIDALKAKSYKSEARRWKRRYLDLKAETEKQKKDLIEEIEDYWKDCDNDASDDERCLRCNQVMFHSVLGMVKG